MLSKYNDFIFTDAGDFAITQAREVEGGDAPQRIKVTLRVTLQLFERSYADNYSLVQQLREALKTQHGTFYWKNTANGQEYINQTVTLVSDDLPEEWGEYHQTINLVFCYYEQNITTQNLPLTFNKIGSANTLTFLHVSKFAESASFERFDTKRKHRKETRARVTVNGMFLVDATTPLAARRSALKVEVQKYRTEMNGAEGVMVFGTGNAEMFNRTVRIEDFTADVDQAINNVPFSFTASYTLFPDETSYATAEVTIEQKDGMTGETFLNLSGKIQAQTEAAARTKLTAILAALTAQYGYNLTAQQLEYNTSANLISANSDGDTFTELSFTVGYRRWRSTNQRAYFKKTGNATNVEFGNVRTWTDDYSATRANNQRSHRTHANGSVMAGGTWAADPALSLSDRRAQLLAMQRRMKSEVNGADGTLIYNDWSQVVRVENLKAEINQAETGIEWSFTATYSLFPNEGGYATCDFTATNRDDVETGDQFLTFTGKIQAPNGTLARAKLATLRTSILSIYGYSLTQQLHSETSAAGIECNGDKTATLSGIEGLETATTDGMSFIELTFNEEYRRRASGTVVSRQMSRSDRDDVTSGLVVTTYSGTVTASGATSDAAYAAALAIAQAFGANREAAIDPTAFFRSSTITQELRQTRTDNATEFVRLTFSYEYQSKMAAGRAYLEMSTQAASDSFGADSETVSGFVVARDFATAQQYYLSEVRNAYAGRLIRGETLTQNKVKAQKGASFVPQEMRIDFSFNVYCVKPFGKVSMRYEMSVARDFRTRTKSTHVRGNVLAFNKVAAQALVTSVFGAMNLGSLMRDETSDEHEYTSDTTNGTIDAHVRFGFDNEYEDALEKFSGVIEMKLSEQVRFSSTRWAVQQLPFNNDGSGGVSIPQPAGINEGGRVVRGTVTASTREECEAWAYRHRSMLTGDADGGNFRLPEEIEFEYEFVPRIDGIAQGVGENVRLWRCNFTFGEILPNYPAPV